MNAPEKAKKRRAARELLSDRTVSVHLRLTAGEAEQFSKVARKEGMTLSGWIRRCALRGCP